MGSIAFDGEEDFIEVEMTILSPEQREKLKGTIHQNLVSYWINPTSCNVDWSKPINFSHRLNRNLKPRDIMEDKSGNGHHGVFNT